MYLKQLLQLLLANYHHLSITISNLSTFNYLIQPLVNVLAI